MDKPDKMLELVNSLRVKHRIVDGDPWFSCPASGECCNDSAGTDCDCGADAHNARVDELENMLFGDEADAYAHQIVSETWAWAAKSLQDSYNDQIPSEVPEGVAASILQNVMIARKYG